MGCTLEGGTDAGSMVLFDPSALPSDFDAKYKVDSTGQLKQLGEEGRLYRFHTNADGSYTLGVYLGNCLPDALNAFARRMDSCDPFHVPGGRLLFAGVEYIFQSDDSWLRKCPHMSEAVEVPPGLYRADFFEFDYPEDFHEELLRRRLPAASFRAHNLMNSLAPIGCISLLGLFGSLFFIPWLTWAFLVLPCGLVLIALPLILSKLPIYRTANAVYKDIHKDFPGYGVILQKTTMG